MNRVYKVIWSKAKHCYVVTSEIARSVTKSASSARSAGRKGAAVLAMAALLFTAGGVLGEAATANVTDVSGSSEARNLIIVTKDDGTSTNFAINNVGKAQEADHAKEADYATAATKATSDGNGHVIENTYVKNVDARVGADGTCVKAAYTVGQNLSALDEQVKNYTVTVLEVGEKVDKNFTDLYAKVQTNADAVTAEETARKQADQNNLKVGDDGVISKVTGNDGTTSSAVNKLVLNVNGNNPITMDDKGIKVGKNSTTMDEKGFYAGSDYDYGNAKAALDATEGKIKGAGGKFTVEADGKVTAASGKIGTVEITSAGAVSGVTDLTVTGTFDSKTLSSTLDAKNDYTTINGGKTQSMNWKMDAVTGETQSSASTFDENGSNAWAKDDDSIGKSTVTADGISQKLSDTGDSPTVYAERTMSQGTDEKYSMVDTVKDGDNTNVSTQTASESSSVVSGKDGKNSYNSYITQNMKKILQKIEDGDGNVLTSTEQTETDITNEAKNKITNKALDVEIDAASSIVSKVSNDYGSNTSTQLSHQTTEEMKAEGKTASYLRGAAEEKSQLTNGAKKTTIDTVAGQTNTNISDGTNTSNDLQKADQIASSVAKGTNTTVVNQDAGSLASSITDGTKVNNTNNTVDKSEQLIKVDDTHFYAEIRTAGSAVEALKSDGNTIISAKDAVTGTVSSAVTDGATITGISQNAMDINLSAAGGTIASGAKNISNTAAEKLSNSAADIENKASKSILNQVGENTSWKMTDGKISESIVNGTASNKENTTVDGTKRIITNDKGTGIYNQTATSNKISLKNAAGDTYFTKSESLDGEKTSVKNPNGSSTINQSAESIVNFVKNSEGTTKTEQSAKDITNTAKNGTITNNAMDVLNKGANSVINKVGDNKVAVKTDSVKAAYGSDTYTTWNGKGITSNTSGNMRNTVGGKMLNNVTGDMENKVGGDLINTVTGDSSLSATNIKNKASTSITNQIGNGSAVKSEMTADGITNMAEGGTIYNKSKDILDEASGDIINWANGEIGNVATKITNITGKNTVISDNDGTTFENEDAKTPFVKGGEVNTKITGNKVETGKVLTDDLTVRGTSEFVGRADFRDDVYVDNNLFVTKETRTDTLYVDHDGYVGGDLKVDGNIETHDAVLSADSRQVVTGRQLYQTNERVDRLDNRIKKVGANAAALAALRPGDFNPDDKFSIAAGFGSYRNANAAALGLFYRPNENVLLSLGTSFGDGENMVNAGVSVKFGRGKSMAERRKEMADEVSSMRDEMRSQDERIAELEEMLKKQSELIEKLSKES